MMRRAVAVVATLIALVTLALLPTPGPAWGLPGPAEPPQVTTPRVIATSAEGREVVARYYGEADAPVQLVVVGQMHGSEPGGRRVIAELAARPIPPGVGLWLVTSMNPDGSARGTRVNARGVDLNRNFPREWQQADRGSIFWSGPRAASEPETRGMMRFLTRVRPAAVLSFHQAYDVVDISHRRSRPAGRQLARWMGERAEVVGCTGPCHGTMTQWIDHELGAIAITVEMDRRVSAREARRAAAAVLRLGTWLGR